MTDISTKAIIERCDHIDHCSLNTHHQDAQRMRALVAERDTLVKQAEEIHTLTGQLAEAREILGYAKQEMLNAHDMIEAHFSASEIELDQSVANAHAGLHVASHSVAIFLAKLANPLEALKSEPAPRHSDDAAVDRFAAAMKAKLAAKRADGRSGWDDKTQCSQQFLSDLLRGHVDKGDPVDVANFAMMLHQRGEVIASTPAAFGFFEDKYPQAVMPSEARSEVLEPLTVEQLVKLLNKLSEELCAAEPAPCSGDMSSQGMPITFTYRNWRGETAQRTAVPKRIWFGSTDWHPEPGWLMTAYGLEKAADRDFALADCAFVAPLQSAQEGVSPITSLITDVVARAEKAMLKHPQPNYIISKFAEESGEVTKALIHAAENRESWANVRDEIVDTLAMLHRLFVEGDQVHGLRPLNDLAQEAQGDA